MEKMYGNIDVGLVKQELSNELCEDESCIFVKMEDMAEVNSIQEKAGNNNTQSRLTEVKTSIFHHKEVPVENCEIKDSYTTSVEHENSSNVSEIRLSMIEINTEYENCHSHHSEPPVELTQTSGMTLDSTVAYTSCSPQRIQTGDTSHMSGVCDPIVSVDINVNTHETSHSGNKPYMCVTAGNLKQHKRTHAAQSWQPWLDQRSLCFRDVCWSHRDFTNYSSILQHIVHFRLEDVPKLVKTLENLAQSVQQLPCDRDLDMSEESRDTALQLSVQAYRSALKSAKLVRALDKVLRCLPVSCWCIFLVEMEVVLEHLLVSSKLADVKSLSALLDHSLATHLSLNTHFDCFTSLLQDLLETCSHVTPGTSQLQDEEFLHHTAKLCIQVLHIFAQDVKSTFSSGCTDQDAVVLASTRHRWDTIVTSLITLFLQRSTPDTIHLLATALVMVITYGQSIDMTQTTCMDLLSVLSQGETCVRFAGRELNIDQCLTYSPADVSVPLSGIIKGMLVCCNKETLSLGKNPVLLHIFPDIVQLCQGPSIHHYQAFSLLKLWYQKLDHTGLLYASSLSSDAFHVCAQALITRGSLSSASVLTTNMTFSSNSQPSDEISVANLMLTNGLACIWPHWDSPVDGVSELVVHIFNDILKIRQRAVKTGLFDSDDLLQQIMSNVLSLAWHSKARYQPLKVLLAYVDFLQVVDVHRKLSADLLRCMKSNSLASVASDVYHACVQQIIKQTTSLGPSDGLQVWADVWMSTLLSGLTSTDSVQMLKMCTYWLPSTLKLLTGSHQFLQESIEEHLRSSSGQSSPRWLFAWVSVAACARQLFHIPSKSLLTSRFLQESLLCVDDNVRIEALKLVCTSLKKGEAMSDEEICLLQEFIIANMKTDSAAFRQHMTSTLKHMFVRIRDSCLTAVRNSHRHRSSLVTGVEFIEWLHQLLMDSLLPGSCYQRRQTSLAVLRELLEIFVYRPDSTTRKGKAQESSDLLLLYAQEQNVWKFFSENNFIVLVCCLQDGVSEIQTQSYDLLVKYHTWPRLTEPIFSTETHGYCSQTIVSPSSVPSVKLIDRACADIFGQALKLISSPRAYENNSGMLMISLLINKCIMEHTWNSSSVCDELSQHITHLAQPADTGVCVPRIHAVSSVLAALLDLLVDRTRSSLDAVMDNLGRNYHIHCLHGVTQSVARVLLNISDAMRRDLVSLSAVDWRTRLQEIVSLNQRIVTLVLEVLSGRQNLESCPSFAEMGVALTSQIAVEQEDHLSSSSPELQLLLSWCWLNLKESCSCLGQVTSLLMTSEDSCIHPVLLLSDIGQTFVKVLTTCRHKGALEGSHHGLYQFCCSLMSSHVPDLVQIPCTLLQQILDSVSQNCLASSVTRRSAGLPIFIQTVLQAAHKHGHKFLLMSTVLHLYDVAARELPAEVDQLQDLSQGHALHILKTIFSDASLAAHLFPLLSQMTILVVQGFDSPSWPIRNAATQLISTLVTKIFGHKSQDGSGRSGMSLEVFSAQYPQLLQFLCEHMHLDVAAQVKVKPSTYIVLKLLAELALSPHQQHSDGCRNLLRDSVRCFLSSPVYSLRQLSGQAYVALSALDLVDETVSSIVQKIGQRNMKMNELHGWLLCVHSFMSSQVISCDINRALLVFVVDNPWLLLGLPSCLLPVSTTLQIIQLALARSQPDLPLLDRLWHLVQACLETISASNIPLQIDRDQCLKHCLLALVAIDTVSTVLTPSLAHQLQELFSSQDHLRQAVLECLQATHHLTTDAGLQGAVLMNMIKETDVARLVASAHLLMRWALKGHLHLQVSDFVAAGPTSCWPQLKQVNFIMHTVFLGCGSVSLDASSYNLLEVWSRQLLAYSQPTQNEELRVLAARSLVIAADRVLKFSKACRHVPGLEQICTRILRASLYLMEDTEAEVKQLVSRFLCHTDSLTPMTFTFCYPAVSKLLVSEQCWSSEMVETLVEMLYRPGQLSTAVDAALTCRQQVLFEPETTSCLTESPITQIWAYNTLQMLALATSGPDWKQLQVAVLGASDELNSNLNLIRSNLCEFPVFNMSCHEEVISSLLGLVLLISYGAEFAEDTHSKHLQALVQSLIQMSFLHPFLRKSTLTDLTVAVSRLLPKQLPSLG